MVRQRLKLRIARRVAGRDDYIIGGVRYVPLDDLKRAEERDIHARHALFNIRNATHLADDGRMKAINGMALKGLSHE